MGEMVKMGKKLSKGDERLARMMDTVKLSKEEIRLAKDLGRSKEEMKISKLQDKLNTESYFTRDLGGGMTLIGWECPDIRIEDKEGCQSINLSIEDLEKIARLLPSLKKARKEYMAQAAEVFGR